jgi:pilus assembly protein CpaD
MSDVALKNGLLLRRLLPAVAITATALLAGCASRDSVTVGSIPDDYRTNHPIVISEKEQTLDLPVAASARGATKGQSETLKGFLANYDRTAAPVLKILTPSGSANGVAASEAGRDFVSIARASGVPSTRIMVMSYQAAPEEVAAPVRVSYAAMRAHTDKCGRWPEDMLESSENKHYANYGCSYQKNLAAQIANPTDLLGPRKQSTIDAANRGVVIGDYQQGSTGLDTSSVDY